MKTLKVSLPQHQYNIYISPWDLKHTATQLKKLSNDGKVYIVTNNVIKKLYHKKIQAAFAKLLDVVWLSIPAGEQHKNLETCEKLLTTLSQKGAHRGSTLLALGGGVVGDITGFVAATYMRGIKYVQMPTSLLAQVDSSVGGKTGVDLTTGKNLVGAFYQPHAVFIHTDFLKTLPKIELKCGLAEVIKYGIIWDASLFKYLRANSKNILNIDPKALTKIIFESCRIKAQVVCKDVKEANLRAILNYGHTLGHSIETLGGYKKYKHGQAIALGMIFAASLSYDLGISQNDHTATIRDLINIYGLPTKLPKYAKSAYKKAMLTDKKAANSIIKFILVAKIGKVKIVPLKIDRILKFL